jgi:hypothetical protein
VEAVVVARTVAKSVAVVAVVVSVHLPHNRFSLALHTPSRWALVAQEAMEPPMRVDQAVETQYFQHLRLLEAVEADQPQVDNQ